MSKEFEKIVLEKLEVLDERTKVDSQKLGNLEIEVKANSKKLSNLEIELKDTQEIVKKLNQDFTKFDYEINKKIDTLFDAYTTNREKDMVLEDNITSLKAKTFDHDIRISNIENKVLTA